MKAIGTFMIFSAIVLILYRVALVIYAWEGNTFTQHVYFQINILLMIEINRVKVWSHTKDVMKMIPGSSLV